MKTANIISALLVLASSITGCSRQVQGPGTDSTGGNVSSSGSVSPNTSVYVLDFSGCINGYVAFTGRYSVAFTIDSSTPVRSYDCHDQPYGVGPGFNSAYDLGSCPIDANSSKIADHVAKLEAGQEAQVLSVDVELTDNFQGGNVCFGYRAQGVWHYDAALIPITEDTTAKKARAHIPIAKGPIDAVFLTSNAGGYSLTKLTYTVANPQ